MADQMMRMAQCIEVVNALESIGSKVLQAHQEEDFLVYLADSPDGVIVTDPNQKVIYVNPAYMRMTGYTLSEWQGKRPAFVASGKTPATVYEEMWHHLQLEGAWLGRVVNRRRSGEEWVSFLSVTRLEDQRGQVAGYMGIAREMVDTITGAEIGMPGDLRGGLMQEAAMFALAEVAELHQGGSRENLRRIHKLTRILTEAAAKRGYPELRQSGAMQAIVRGSSLHDIGKMAIPQGLLKKPGRLTPEEYEVVKTHTIAGYKLLESPALRSGSPQTPCLFSRIAASIARSHHERWDGTGYPDGLAGEEIPLEARLVAIADVYEALRSRRPYKEPWSHHAAVDYIRKAAGLHFDPNLVQLFLSLQDEFEAVWALKIEET